MSDPILDQFDLLKKIRKVKERETEIQECKRNNIRYNYGYLPKVILDFFCGLEYVPDELFRYSSNYGSMVFCIPAGNMAPELRVVFYKEKDENKPQFEEIPFDACLNFDTSTPGYFSANLAGIEISWNFNALGFDRKQLPFINRKLNMMVMLEKVIIAVKENYYTREAKSIIDQIINEHEIIDYPEAHRLAIGAI